MLELEEVALKIILNPSDTSLAQDNQGGNDDERNNSGSDAAGQSNSSGK